MMKTLTAWLILCCGLTGIAYAQGQNPKSFTFTANSQCLIINTDPSSTSGVYIDVSGTFSLTLQPAASVSGSTYKNVAVVPTTSQSQQATITAVGGYNAAVAGPDHFEVCTTGYVSGSAVVTLSPTTGVASNTLGGGGGGSGTVTNIATTSPVTGGPITGTGTIAISGVTAEQGNGAKLQLSTGTTTLNDCVKFDANGNTVDAGAACGSAGGANAALSNLSAVSINTSLLAQTGADIGGTSNPFRDLYLFGSGTYGSTYFHFTGTPTSTRTWTVQDASDTFVGRATTDTLTNKSIAGSEVNSSTVGATYGGTGADLHASVGFLRAGNPFTAAEISGDCTTSASYAIICTKTNSVSFGTFATQNYATPPTIGGTTPGIGHFAALSATGQILATEPTGSVWGSATGGAQGAGTLNAVNLYVNGVAVGAGGSGTVNSGTATHLAIYATSTTAVSNDATATDDGTTFTYSGTGGLKASAGPLVSGLPAGGVGSSFFLDQEGTIPTGLSTSGQDDCYADSTQHGILCNFNAGTTLPLVQGPASSTSGHAVKFNSTNGGLLADAGYSATAIPLADLATQGANTVVANVTGSTAVPTAASIPSGIQNYVAGTGYNQATGHQLQVPLACPDSSGSGTAQSCSTGGTTYTPAAADCIVYTTTTTNSGTGLTVAINGGSAKSVAIPGASGWTTTLTSSIIPANKPLLVCYDGTNLNVQQTGTAASGGAVTSVNTLTGSVVVEAATAGQMAVSGGASAALTGAADMTYSTHTFATTTNGIFDWSAATGTAAFKVPSNSTNTASAAGVIDYDSTNSNYHTNSGADSLIGVVPTASVPTTGDVIDASVASSKFLLHDSGFLSSNVVRKDTTNTGAAAMTLDMHAATTAPSVQLPNVVGGTILAGTSTANLSAPAVFQNTNSSNNNTSIGLAVTTPGTSTGQVALNVNGATTQASLAQFTTGATYTAGVQSGATDVADVLPTGAIQTKGTTAGFGAYSQGSTSTSVAPCNAANTICEQAPAAVTSYLLTKPGAAPAQSGSLKSTTTAGVESYVHTIPANTDPNGGIHNFSSSSLTPGGAAGTYYYLAPSALTMPATYSTAIGAGTTMTWHVAMSKTGAGTGAFNVRLYYGTNGSIADTTLATQSVGTATAALDDMELNVVLTFTSATAGYWTISCLHSAATATGFGCAIGSQQFSGTLSGLTTTTASLIFGLGYSNTTGTAVITVPLVTATAYGVN